MNKKKRILYFSGADTVASLIAGRSPTAWWRLNEAGPTPVSAVDYSGNGNDGTYVSPVNITNGEPSLANDNDTCIKFNGSSGAITGADATFEISGGKATWEVLTKTDGVAAIRGIISKNGTTGWAIAQYDTTLRMYIGGNSKHITTNDGVITWTDRHHIMVVFDDSVAEASRAKLYVDGIERATTLAGSPLGDGSASGSDMNFGIVATFRWLGWVDEFAFYNGVAYGLAEAQATAAAAGLM